MAKIRAMSILAVCLGLPAAVTASASEVTFDWQQTSGSVEATGSITLSSASLTAQDAEGTAQFDLTGSGSGALAEVAAFSFSFDGHSLSSVTSNSTGWRDNYPGEPVNFLESTWTASETFGNSNPPVGTLQVIQSSGQTSTVSFGGVTASGYWALQPAATPVPVPASVWLLLPSLASFGLLARRRKPAET